jgi:hypothetical protein
LYPTTSTPTIGGKTFVSAASVAEYIARQTEGDQSDD